MSPTHGYLYQSAIDQQLRSPGGDLWRYVDDQSRRLQNQEMIESPVDSGRLRASHDHTVERRGNVIVGRAGSAVEYALVVYKGHGEIVPRKGQYLRFVVGGQVVYAKRVRAVAGNPWLERAWRAVMDIPFSSVVS
jgi:hypothetical protein